VEWFLPVIYSIYFTGADNMDPISIIALALVAGAAAAAKDVAAQAVKDGYAGLKALIVRKFGGKGDVQNAVEGAEKRPDSEARQAVLKEELQTAGADKDDEVLKQAQALLELLKRHGALDDASYSAINTGSGAIAQGPGAVAAGAGGISIGGNVGGRIVTGTNIDGDLVRGQGPRQDLASNQHRRRRLCGRQRQRQRRRFRRAG
jgi:hypothetical protein